MGNSADFRAVTCKDKSSALQDSRNQAVEFRLSLAKRTVVGGLKA